MPPPATRVPRVDAKTLVSLEGLAFPQLPGVRVPRVAHTAYRADYGPRFRSDGIVEKQPPELGPAVRKTATAAARLGHRRHADGRGLRQE